MTTEGRHTEECREAFEIAMTDGYDFKRDSDGMYVKPDTFEAFEGFRAAWQARTESELVKELVAVLRAIVEQSDTIDRDSRGKPYRTAASQALYDRAVAALAKANPTRQVVKVVERRESSAFETDLAFKLSVAAEDVFMERKRQQMVEGWTIEHDDSHHGGHHEGELALAAASYCMSASADVNPLLTAKARHREYAEAWWPQHWGVRKPKGARRDLVRAAALIIAEIERLDRKSKRIDGHSPKVRAV